jgi:hypothetical protein
VKGWPRVVQRKVQEALETLREDVRLAESEDKFGSLPTTNLLQCFSVKPECRPPFDKMFSEEKWDPPAACLSDANPVVPSPLPAPEKKVEGGEPLRKLRAQIEAVEKEGEAHLFRRDRARSQMQSGPTTGHSYWKGQEGASEAALKRSGDKLQKLHDQLPAWYSMPPPAWFKTLRLPTPKEEAEPLPPSPPAVLRSNNRPTDITNVVLDTFNGGARMRKTKKSSKRGNMTRRKNTRRWKSSRKRC